MDFREYQAKAHETAQYETEKSFLTPAQNYVLMGLAGEAGELANLCKKALRGDYGETPADNLEFFSKLVGEMGGVLWYLAEACTVFGLSLSAVAAQNLAKLADRSARGVIKGSGDDR